jgi:hypothetical protein
MFHENNLGQGFQLIVYMEHSSFVLVGSLVFINMKYGSGFKGYGQAQIMATFTASLYGQKKTKFC